MEEVLKLLIIGAGIGVVLLGVKFFSKKSEAESEAQTQVTQESIQQPVLQEAQEAIVDTAINNTKDIQDDQKKIVAAITAAIKYHREG